ncbi:MAG: hypothetical protein OEW87_07450, partial [Flavobacteriaceae bacterium]|nr:hypothetical protein [Flavobacteriaceae bacterium]
MRPLFAILLLLSASIFAQENALQINDNKDVKKINKLELTNKDFNKDSLELVNHKEATLIDSLWLNTLYNSALYDDFQFV